MYQKVRVRRVNCWVWIYGYCMYAGGMACSSSRNGQQSRPRLRANYVADPTAHFCFQPALSKVFLQAHCEDMIWDKGSQVQVFGFWFHYVTMWAGLNNEQARNICSICVRNIPPRLSLRSTGHPDCRVRDNCFMSVLKQPPLLGFCPPILFEKNTRIL